VPRQVCPVAPGSVLEHRYRLDDRIALGGVGEVWQGTDLVLRRVVAVKLLRPEYAQDEDCLARFRAEGRHAALLSHPNIAQVYDCAEQAPPLPGFLVMELVDGQSLARLLAGGPLSPARTMGIVAQAARGLQAAHTAGLVHRDIKPGNLLIGRDDQVKITDFGIAQVPGSARLTRTGLLVGTAAYLAPERASGGPATPASDLYSLGVVAYECLTGQAPFDGEPLAVALAHLQQAMPPLPPPVPAAVAALVAELTAKDPSARPPSAADVSDRAERLRTGPPPPAAGPASPLSAAGPDSPLSAAAPDSPLSAAAPASPPPAAAPAGLTTAPPELPNEPGGPPPGQAGAGDARARPRRRLSRAGPPARAALVVAAVAVAALGWALVATHGSAPDQRLSPDTHPASPRAGPSGAAGPRAAASPGPTGTGGAGPHRSPAAAHAHRRGRPSAAPSSPPPPSPTPTPTPTLPLPTPSLPLPTPSLSLSA
jgi:eukaryotic-like serine/threonine-protein kinase